MIPERDLTKTFEIGNDFAPAGLKAIVRKGIEKEEILFFDLEKIKMQTFEGYQFNLELRVEEKRRLVTFEYQMKEWIEGSGHYRGMYVSVPVGTLDMNSEEVDSFEFDV